MPVEERQVPMTEPSVAQVPPASSANTFAAPLATALSETLATSDWPGGVVNVLFGDVAESLSVACKLDDLDGIVIKVDQGR